MDAVLTVIDALGAWLTLGLGFALAFVFGGGIARVDPAARGAGLGVRLLLLPGLAALWPVMALRWGRAIARGARAASNASDAGPRA